MPVSITEDIIGNWPIVINCAGALWCEVNAQWFRNPASVFCLKNKWINGKQHYLTNSKGTSIYYCNHFVRPSVCVSVNIAKKAFHRSTSFSMGGFPWTQGWSDSILKKNRPGARVAARARARVCVCVCVCVRGGGQNLDLMIRDRRNIFQWQ